ncbi:MAG: hypothetical protein WCJ40_06165 [Planctomycetota bacterium]
MTPLNINPNNGIHKKTGRNRKAFLLVDGIAGAALAAIALGLTLWVLSTDVKIRKAQDQRIALLQSTQNLLERLETIAFEKLTAPLSESIATDLVKATNLPDLHFQVEIAHETAPVEFKRLRVKGQIGQSESLLIRLWRDRYPGAKKS